MSLELCPVVGTIQIEPLGDDRRECEADDSSLGQLLHELAHRERLDDGDRPIRFVAATRLSRYGVGDDYGHAVVRADLARLLVDLQAEYDELESRSP